MDKVTGIVLAGGKSKRLGYRNKALLKFGCKSIIEYVLDALMEVTDSVILIANSQEEYMHLGLPMFPDLIPGSGSLGGIYTGLKVSKTYHNLVVACDMPFIKSNVLEILMQNMCSYDVVVPETPDGYHPTCAVYSRQCIPSIEAQIQKRDLKISAFFSQVKVSKMSFPLCDHQNVFFNINTEEDYQTALSIALQKAAKL